jgi:hypothetical protein
MVALASAVLLAAGPVAVAAGHGGGGMGHAGFGGGFHGGFARGGFARGGIARGGYGRGYARGYGGRGYGGRGYGWRGGYGWGPGWGLGLGLGLGLYLDTLPWDYATYWWGGVPYYYADDNYYVWDSPAGEYQEVQPPAQVAQQAANAPAPSQQLYAYPKNGQSEQQQTSDKAQCRQWAATQMGSPPNHGEVNRPPGVLSTQPPTSDTATGALGEAIGTAPPSDGPPAAGGRDFLRAEAACLQGRGYSVD